jgi:RNA polymerase sigma factor (sigma-70 family)
VRPLWLRSWRAPRPAPDERPAAPPPPADPLVEEAAGGDGPAFRALFERHAPALRRFLRDLLQDEAAADEATQEAFVRAHAKLPTLRESGRFGPWLFRIARHVALEELRERRGRPADADEALAEAPAELPSPEAILLHAEALAMFRRALGGLPEERRACLLLAADHRLGYDDIASVMGWSPTKVRNELHRAREGLRAELARQAAEGHRR